jgi:hypothetical protein
VQGAQNAMRNADNALEKLEGFISKMEDFHRLMNFLEVRLYISFIFSHQSWVCHVQNVCYSEPDVFILKPPEDIFTDVISVILMQNITSYRYTYQQKQ